MGGMVGGGTFGGGTPGGGMPMLGGGNEPVPGGATFGIFGGIMGGGSEMEVDESSSFLMSSSVLIIVPGCLTMYPADLFISPFPLPNTEPYCVAFDPYWIFFGATCSLFWRLVLPREFLN